MGREAVGNLGRNSTSACGPRFARESEGELRMRAIRIGSEPNGPVNSRVIPGLEEEESGERMVCSVERAV